MAAIDGTHQALADYLSGSGNAPQEFLGLAVDAGGSADLGIDGPVRGSVGAGEMDVYRVDVGADETVTIDLDELGIDGGVLLSLYDADGNLLGVDPGSDGDHFLSYTATEGTEIYVRVESFAGTGEGIEIDYSLDVEHSGGSGHASLATLASYLEEGYWSTARKWNLSDEGYLAKGGTLTYTLDGYSTDGNGLTAARAELVRESFKLYEAVLGIDFEETSDRNADFRFGDNDSGAYAGSAYGIVGGEGVISYAIVNIDRGWYGGRSDFTDYTHQTVLHEIGHALGLGHQGQYNGSANYDRDAVYANDSWQGSMMSYFSQTQNSSIDASYAFLLSPMAADWIALDSMYGEFGFSTANAFTDDTVWGFNTTITEAETKAWANLDQFASSMAFTIVDSGGIDTVNFSGYSQNQRIDLTVTKATDTSATTSDIGNETGNMTLAVGTVIENAVSGSGHDQIIGNEADNTLDGGAGNDTLTGGEGDDDLIGGAGIDQAVFTGDYADYQFTEFDGYWQVVGEGTDKVYDSVENLVFADQTVAYGDIVGTGGPAPSTAPTAQDDALAVGEDGVLQADLFADNGAGADAHSGGLAFTLSHIDGAASGPVTLSSGAEVSFTSGGDIVFDTNGAYDALGAGETTTETFDYTITDALGASSTATVTVTITGANDGPVAADDAFSVNEDAFLSGFLLRDNGNGADADPDTGDAIAISAINGQASVGSGIFLPSGAILAVLENGTFSYNQNGAFQSLSVGQTATDSFTYTIVDESGASDTATATITVAGTNDGPTGTDDSFTVDAGGELTGSLLGNDTDPDAADTLSVLSHGGCDAGRALTLDSGARVRVQSDGTFVYNQSGAFDNLAAGETAVDSFTYVLSDGNGGTDTATVAITVESPAPTPVDPGTSGDGDTPGVVTGLDDTLYGTEGVDVLDGGDGNDLLVGSTEADHMVGGAGVDTVDYSGSLRGVVVRLDRDMGLGRGSDASGDTLDGIENLIGSSLRDVVIGDEAANVILGNAGNDKMRGGGGDDTLEGGEGHDRLSGDDGADVVTGGAGRDKLGGGDGEDQLFGGADNDHLNGGADNDQLFGGDGNDRMIGHLGDDSLFGGAGNDDLRGAAGDDVLFGGTGNDVYRPGAGADRIVFTDTSFGRDMIIGWKDGEDMLDFTQAGLGFDDFTIASRKHGTMITLTEDPEQSLLLFRVNVATIDETDFM